MQFGSYYVYRVGVLARGVIRFGWVEQRERAQLQNAR